MTAVYRLVAAFLAVIGLLCATAADPTVAAAGVLLLVLLLVVTLWHSEIVED